MFRLFDFLKKLIGTDEDSRINRLSNRLEELRQEEKGIEEKLKCIVTKTSDILWFHLSQIKEEKNNFEEFSPPKLQNVQKMIFLLQRRKDKELKQKQIIRNLLSDLYDKTLEQIKLKKPDKAEEYLYKASPLVEELNEENFTSRFKSLQSDIKELKGYLIQEQKREQEEKKRKLAEEKAIKEQQEAILKEQLRQKELEKERKAREYEEHLAKVENEKAEEIEKLRALTTRKKTNPDAILNYLKIHNISYFYHFTDKRNINSIKKYGGLYSWEYCEQHDIKIPNAGGSSLSRDLDCKYNLEDYVRLSFCSDHPMAYRLSQEGAELVLLKIRIDVATFKDTLFSDMNATDSGHSCGGDISDLLKVDIIATKANYVSKDSSIFKQHQAECMVKTFIPIEFIENISNPIKMKFS